MALFNSFLKTENISVVFNIENIFQNIVLDNYYYFDVDNKLPYRIVPRSLSAFTMTNTFK